MKQKNLLKIFLLMVFAVCSIGLASCGDDDDNAVVDSSIIGSWEETNYFDGTWVWTFNSNGKGSCHVTDGSRDYTFSYSFSFDGTTLVVSGVEDGENYTDTYTVTFSSDGKTMTLYDGRYTTTMKKK